MIEAYKNERGFSSIGRGSYPRFTKFRKEVVLPNDLRDSLTEFGLKQTPTKVTITDKNFTSFNNWTGYVYF